MPGAKLYLALPLTVEALCVAAANPQSNEPSNEPNNESHSQTVDTLENESGNSATYLAAAKPQSNEPSNEPNNELHQHYSQTVDNLENESGNSAYLEDYNKNNIHPPHQGYLKYPTTNQPHGRGTMGAGPYAGPPKKTYAQVCHDQVKHQNIHQQQQQQSKVYGKSHTAGNNAGNCNDSNGSISTWIGVSNKKRAFGSAIKVTLRDTSCNFVSTTTLSKHASVGELIKKLGGAPGARIQVLRHTEGGFLLGQSFMSGTRKSLDEAGFGLEGNIHVVLFQP